MADASDPDVRGIFARSREIAPSTITLDVVRTASVLRAIELVRLREDGSSRFTNAVRSAMRGKNPFARYISRNSNARPLARVLRAVYSHWDAICLREAPYYDPEFWDAHSGYYNARFLQHPRFCERFHFFVPKRGLRGASADALKTAIENGTFQSNSAAHADRWEYLGYVILRPTLSSCVGRTAIRFDAMRRAGTPLTWEWDPLEAGGHAYLTMRHPCVAHILGTTFKIDTVEFMQQDPQLGACATVSLWVATHVARERFDLNKYNFRTITRQALNTRADPRTELANMEPDAPGAGLTPSEMMAAIAATGARPMRFLPGATHANDRLLFEAHGFVTSGVPVILLLDKLHSGDANGGWNATDAHAVVLVGHNAPNYPAVAAFRAQYAADCDDRHVPLAALSPVFYAHDDRTGPFKRLVFFYNEDGELRARVDGDEMRVGSAVVPVPTDISCGAATSLEYAQAVVDDWPTCDLVDGLMRGRDCTLLWTASLVEGARFKASVAARRFNREFVRWYARLMLPKYVWLLEVSAVPNPEGWPKFVTSKRTRPILGEFLMDATAPEAEPRCLAYRIGPVGFDYRQEPHLTDPSVVVDDNGQSCRYRSYDPSSTYNLASAAKAPKGAA